MSDQYEFEITDQRNADYVFFGVDGYDVLNYQGIRIFVTGENVTPNLAITDYAMAFDKITFNDRYVWMPLIKLYRDSYGVLKQSRPLVDRVMDKKNDFCAYVMSNAKDSAIERLQIFDLINSYKKVNSGGSWRNNVGGRVNNKIEFQSRHKFVIAFENSSSPGYLTEKFAEAAASNAVPIYWGDPEIGKLFNPNAFINCHDYSSLQDAVNQVIRVDQDENLYRQMLSQPWFPDNCEPQCLRDEIFISFLKNIFDQECAMAYRRNRSRWGLKTEKRLYDMYFRPHLHGIKLLQKKWRDLRRS